MTTASSTHLGITRRGLLWSAALLPALKVGGQTAGPDGFRVYTDGPRLFLRPARLKLLRRERERRSLRWDQFELLWTAAAEFPEFGWTAALRYQIAQDDAAGRQAVAWAVAKIAAPGPPMSENVMRQIAIIADWCEPLMSPTD